jgi:hypothetical protein
VQQALEHLKAKTTFLKILGSYPRKNPKRPVRINKEQMTTFSAKAASEHLDARS